MARGVLGNDPFRRGAAPRPAANADAQATEEAAAKAASEQPEKSEAVVLKKAPKGLGASGPAKSKGAAKREPTKRGAKPRGGKGRSENPAGSDGFATRGTSKRGAASRAGESRSGRGEPRDAHGSPPDRLAAHEQPGQAAMVEAPPGRIAEHDVTGQAAMVDAPPGRIAEHDVTGQAAMIDVPPGRIAEKNVPGQPAFVKSPPARIIRKDVPPRQRADGKDGSGQDRRGKGRSGTVDSPPSRIGKKNVRGAAAIVEPPPGRIAKTDLSSNPSLLEGPPGRLAEHDVPGAPATVESPPSRIGKTERTAPAAAELERPPRRIGKKGIAGQAAILETPPGRLDQSKGGRAAAGLSSPPRRIHASQGTGKAARLERPPSRLKQSDVRGQPAFLNDPLPHLERYRGVGFRTPAALHAETARQVRLAEHAARSGAELTPTTLHAETARQDRIAGHDARLAVEAARTHAEPPRRTRAISLDSQRDDVSEETGGHTASVAHAMSDRLTSSADGTIGSRAASVLALAREFVSESFAGDGAALTTSRALASVGRALRSAIGLGGGGEVDVYGADQGLREGLTPVADFLYHRYFRVTVQDAQLVPPGPVILVANHGGALPLDGPVLCAALGRERPELSRARWLVEDQLFYAPFVGTVLNRLGAVRASPENATRLLADGYPLVVFPEGIHGIQKPFSERYQLKRFGRGGFVKLALRAKVPIVPVAIVGAEETVPLFAKLPAGPLGLPYLPVTPTGLLPVPLPARWFVRFAEPLRIPDHGDADDLPLVQKLADETRDTIQGMLEALLRERGSAYFG